MSNSNNNQLQELIEKLRSSLLEDIEKMSIRLREMANDGKTASEHIDLIRDEIDCLGGLKTEMERELNRNNKLFDQVLLEELEPFCETIKNKLKELGINSFILGWPHKIETTIPNYLEFMDYEDEDEWYSEFYIVNAWEGLDLSWYEEQDDYAHTFYVHGVELENEELVFHFVEVCGYDTWDLKDSWSGGLNEFVNNARMRRSNNYNPKHVLKCLVMYMDDYLNYLKSKS